MTKLRASLLGLSIFCVCMVSHYVGGSLSPLMRAIATGVVAGFVAWAFTKLPPPQAKGPQT